jgi:hypothetical protein
MFSKRSDSMRRRFGLGVILSSGVIAACSSSSPIGGGGGAGGAGGRAGAAGAAAGNTGQGGGVAGQGAGGAADQGVGGAAGASLATSPPPMTGLAVVNSDFSTTSLSILDTTGALVHADCVDSATGAAGGATKTISGDAVLPSQPQLGGDVILVDRGNVALSFVNASTCAIVRQIPVPGPKTDPHDVVMLASDKAYVTRYDLNPAATDPTLSGNDIAVIDPTSGLVKGRISLDAYASSVAGRTILARPDRALLVDGRVIVSLNEGDQAFANYGEGKLVVVDPVTDSVTSAVALTGLANCEGMTYVDASKSVLIVCGGPFDGSTAQSGVAVVDVGVSPPALTRVIPATKFDGRPLDVAWILAVPPIGGGTRAFAVTNDPNAVNPDALFDFDYVTGTATQFATSNPYTFGQPAGLPGLLLMPNSTVSMPRIALYDVSAAPTATTTFTSDPVTHLPPQEIAPY